MSVQVQPMADLFYFGQPGRQLFGALHSAETFAQREYGIVICQPFGDEYIRSHRACRQLALRLAEVGFPVLRFEYSGMGDSAGEAEDSNLDTWAEDIELAIDTLQDRAGVESICLAGLRLGASLAMRVASTSPDVSALILWEPVLDGQEYLAELARHHQEMLWRFFVDLERLAARTSGEYLGSPVGPSLRSQIERVSLPTSPPGQVEEVLIAERQPTPSAAQLQRILASSGIEVGYQHIPSFAVWQEDVDKGLVPDPVLRGIVSWAEEVLP